VKLLLLCLLVPQLMIVQGAAADATGSISGQIRDRQTQEPLGWVHISVLNTRLGASSDADGEFVIPGVPAGRHTIRASLIGYESANIEGIVVAADQAATVRVELVAKPIRLSEVTVAPGRFEIMGRQPESHQALTRKDIETVSFAEDIYRAAARLPGIASSDFSSKLVVRGGEHDEVLVLFDGLEIYEPFHMKDFGGLLSIIDVEAIEGIDLLTGGFPAEYGNRQSGVLNMRLKRAPAGYKRLGLGISFMNMRAMTEGSLEDGRGAWFFSARRGYLDLVLDLVGEGNDLSPKYYDALGKVEYRLNSKHTLSANVLQAGDRFDLMEEDASAELHSRYGNGYGWLRVASALTPRVFAQTVLAAGAVTRQRQGGDSAWYWYGPDELRLVPISGVEDHRDFHFYGLRQDWQIDLSERWYLKWGLDAKRLRAEYDYTSVKYEYRPVEPYVYEIVGDSVGVYREPSGNQVGVYLAARCRPVKALTAEVGLRYDAASHTEDRLISPRINLAYAAGGNSAVRVGWGHYYQTENIDEIRVQDGETGFYPAELAEHRTVGLEHRFEDGLHLRLEAYRKKISDVRPEYSNTADDFVAFPEVVDDRARVLIEGSTAEGVEVFLKKDTGSKWSWWASYALAQCEDEVKSILLAGEERALNGRTTYPRKFDQRHTLYLDVNYRPSGKWHLSAAWQYHSGRPYTSKHLELKPYPEQPGSYYYEEAYGEYNGQRYPAYHRLDLRVNRYFDTSRGRFAVFAEIINLYNHGNVRSYDYNWICRRIGENNVECRLERDAEYWIPRLPSIGISWGWDL